MKTNEIHLTTEIEEEAKEEYSELMNDYREKLKQEEEEAKKVKVVGIKTILNMSKNTSHRGIGKKSFKKK